VQKGWWAGHTATVGVEALYGASIPLSRRTS
jgi:hypothetical protein